MINHRINTRKIIAIGIQKREEVLWDGMVMEDFMEDVSQGCMTIIENMGMC